MTRSTLHSIIGAYVQQCAVRLIRPNHCAGIDGNERANQLAPVASAQKFTGPERAIGISVQAWCEVLYSPVVCWSTGTVQTLEDNSEGCRQTKCYSSMQAQLSCLEGRLLLIDISHTREDPTCSSCWEDEETALHFLGPCPATVGDPGLEFSWSVCYGRTGSL